MWPLALPDSVADERTGLMEAGESQAVTWTAGRADDVRLTFNPVGGNGVVESLFHPATDLAAISVVASSPAQQQQQEKKRRNC